MLDFQLICFNGAHRTQDRESTDAMAIHPLTEKCEQFIKQYCQQHSMACVGGVALVEGISSDLINALAKHQFIEQGTFFTDSL